MDLWIIFLLGIFVSTNNSPVNAETEIARSLDITSQWQPVLGQTFLSTGPGIFHGNHALLPSGPSGVQPPMQSRLISVPSIDMANKLQLAQIAHHNAQILRHIKGLNPPVTQYKNPFPVFHKPMQTGQVMNFVNPSSNVAHNLHASGSNIQHTILPSSFMKQTFITGKPTFIGKKDFHKPQFFNGIHTSTAKIPTLVKTVPILKQVTKYPNHHAHEPLIYRDVTLTPPPRPSPSTSRPHAIINRLPFQTHQQTNYQLPTSDGYSSFSYYGSAPHLVRDKQPKLASPVFNLPVDSHISFRGSGGFISHNEKFIPKQSELKDKLIPIKPTSGFTPMHKDPFSVSYSTSTTQAPINSSPQYEVKPVVEHQDEFVPAKVLIPSFLQQVQKEPVPPKIVNETDFFRGSSFVSDDFTKNLVPPPFNHLDSSIFRSTSTPSPQVSSSTPSFEQFKAINILSKYNIPAESPLQDASKFNYNRNENKSPHFFPVSTTTAPITFPTQNNHFGIHNDHNTFFTTEKPDIFKHLKRPTDNIYKEHKLMHPSYTGARHPNDIRPSVAPVFLPTPTHERHPETNFFTIEDAITLAAPQQITFPTSTPIPPTQRTSTLAPPTTPKPQAVDIDEEHVRYPQNYYAEFSNQDYDEPATTTTTTTMSPPMRMPMIEQAIQNPTRTRQRNKMRRRRPRPQVTKQITNAETIDSMVTTVQTYMPIRRPPHHIKNVQTTYMNPVTTERNVAQLRPQRVRRPQSRVRTTTPIPVKEEVQTTRRARPTKDNPALDFYSVKSTLSSRPVTTSTEAPPTTQPRKNLVVTLLRETTRIPEQETTSYPTRTRQPTTTTNQPNDEENTLRSHTNTISSTKTLSTYPDPDTTTFTENQSEFNHEPLEIENETSVQSTTELLPSTRVNNKQAPTTTVSATAIDRGHTQTRNRLRYKYRTQTSAETQDAVEENTKPVESSTITKEEITNDVEPEVITTKLKATETATKTTHLKPVNRYEAPKTRPRFSVKDYRLRLKVQNSSSTSTTTTTQSPLEVSSTSSYSRVKYPTRRRLLPQLKSRATSTTTETHDSAEAIEPSPSSSSIESNRDSAEVSSETSAENIQRKSYRGYQSRSTSTTPSSSTTTGLPTRRGVNTRRDFAHRSRYTSSTTTSAPVSSTTSEIAPVIKNITLRRPPTLSLKERIQNYYKKKDENASDANSILSDLVNITMETKNNEDLITESNKMESAIMKIAKDDHTYRSQTLQQATSTEPLPPVADDLVNDLKQSSSEHSQRVADLTVSGSSNNFKMINGNMLSRRIPGYFTLATDDPILPIEAFFSNVDREKKSRRRS